MLDRSYVCGLRGPDGLLLRLEDWNPQVTKSERFDTYHFALSDSLGSVIALVPPVSGSDQPPSVLQQFDYDPYGNPRGIVNDWNVLFAGYYRDETTGLYLVRNRTYHPTLGRWLQVDPAGGTDGLNTYEYVLGNPLGFTDPSGEEPVTIAIAGAFLIAAALGWSQTVLASHGEASVGEQALGAGLGLIGGFNPWGTYGSAFGFIGGYYGGEFTGAWDPVAGAQWGSLGGGLAGGAARIGWTARTLPGAIGQSGWRAIGSHAREAAPELLSLVGSGAGAIIGSRFTDDRLLGANYGMMIGGAPGGLWRIGRLLRSTNVRQLGTSFRRFFWDDRDFDTEISPEYWLRRQPSNGRALHHWLFTQESRVLRGFRNAGFNLVELDPFRGWFHRSLSLNTWMGFAQRWNNARAIDAFLVENAIRLGIIGFPIAPIAAGYYLFERSDPRNRRPRRR